MRLEKLWDLPAVRTAQRELLRRAGAGSRHNGGGNIGCGMVGVCEPGWVPATRVSRAASVEFHGFVIGSMTTIAIAELW